MGLAALFPLGANGYWLSIGVTAMMYVALATSWALFFRSDALHLARHRRAFFGVGGYIVGTGMSDYAQPFWLMAAISPIVGAILAALIGFATLRLSGVYFVIFTLGLAEMIRNVVSWVQNNFLGSRGLYVLTDLRGPPHLLDAAGRRRRGLPARLVGQPSPHRLCASHHRRR